MGRKILPPRHRFLDWDEVGQFHPFPAPLRGRGKAKNTPDTPFRHVPEALHWH